MKFVCDQCVCDPVLAEIVLENLTSDTCSYCNRKDNDQLIASDLDVIVSHIQECVDLDFDEDMVEELGWDDGTFAGTPSDISDVLQDHFGWCPDNWKLYEDVEECFPPELGKKGYWAGTSSERASDAWNYFCTVVKHRRRYTFWDDRPSSFQVDFSPTEIVAHITEQLSSVGLIRTFPPGTRFWRVRSHLIKDILGTADEFTSQVPEWAGANRMSPAGIPMFYGAIEFRTACQEVFGRTPDATQERATGIWFENIVPLNLLDLTVLPQPRSGFERWDESMWDAVLFLRDFVRDLSKPIKKDGRQHIEYVPTQVFTEFVRYRLLHVEQPMHGVLYPSCYDGTTCAVLFATKEQCLPSVSRLRDEPQLLNPFMASLNSVDAAQVKRWFEELPNPDVPS